MNCRCRDWFRCHRVQYFFHDFLRLVIVVSHIMWCGLIVRPFRLTRCLGLPFRCWCHSCRLMVGRRIRLFQIWCMSPLLLHLYCHRWVQGYQLVRDSYRLVFFHCIVLLPRYMVRWMLWYCFLGHLLGNHQWLVYRVGSLPHMWNHIPHYWKYWDRQLWYSTILHCGKFDHL